MFLKVATHPSCAPLEEMTGGIVGSWNRKHLRNWCGAESPRSMKKILNHFDIREEQIWRVRLDRRRSKTSSSVHSSRAPWWCPKSITGICDHHSNMFAYILSHLTYIAKWKKIAHLDRISVINVTITASFLKSVYHMIPWGLENAVGRGTWSVQWNFRQRSLVRVQFSNIRYQTFF